ncbi:ubiquitin-like-conjugating enzyme ATG10 [Eurosta solidaginis]|uniref:ubiquitin-like-conjugating enzyme ATG10 n=1 Tax=Eurosta solidaginis TaxID=178769 RepID=UPI0035315331
MSVATINWQGFLQDAIEFEKIANSLGDTWTLYKKDDDEGNTYLIYEQKIPNTIDKTNFNYPLEDRSCGFEDEKAVVLEPTYNLLKLEYHILYSISYEVPVLYFRIYRDDGSLVGLEDAWHIFRCNNRNSRCTDGTSSPTDADMLNIMTQMDHPILRKPYFAIHPCRTAQLLGQAGISRNRILTFISLVGPYVKLVLRNEYGTPYAE